MSKRILIAGGAGFIGSHAADQYMLDYARTFGLPMVVFRMSCIYGLHQFATEDQGWVAHFSIRTLRDRPEGFMKALIMM